MEKLLIIDGNSIINRTFYGIRPLTNSRGLHTNALYGTLNILLKNLDTVKPSYAAVAFDLPAPTFRHKKYAEYKAGRKGMPEELAMQLPYCKDMCKALGLHVLELAGYEADDIIGTVTLMSENSGGNAYVLTGDRDSLQLISDRVTVLLAVNNDTVKYDRAKFNEKYGIQPEEFVAVKALMGDSSDNIPGVKGVGEKTALKLIAQFGTLDRVYENLESAGLGNSAKQKMQDGRESAYLSEWLARIDRNVPLGLDLAEIRYDGFDRDRLYRLLSDLEFFSHIKKLGLSQSDSSGTNNQTSNSAKTGNKNIAAGVPTVKPEATDNNNNIRNVFVTESAADENGSNAQNNVPAKPAVTENNKIRYNSDEINAHSSENNSVKDTETFSSERVKDEDVQEKQHGNGTSAVGKRSKTGSPEIGRQLTLDDLLSDPDTAAEDNGENQSETKETNVAFPHGTEGKDNTVQPVKLITGILDGYGADSKETAAEIKKIPAFGEMPVFITPENGAEVKNFGEFTAFAYENGEAAFFDGEKGIIFRAESVSEAVKNAGMPAGGLIVYDSKSLIKECPQAEIKDDIMLMAYVCDPSKGHYPLEELSEIYLHRSPGNGAAEKAHTVYGIYSELIKLLESRGSLPLYRNIELPLARVLCEMESYGFALDTNGLTAFSEKLEKTEDEYKQKIFGLAGEEFNINSPKQLGQILFEKLGLPTGKKTKTGYSTNAEILEKLKPDHPIVALILEYRAVAKLRSTYCVGLLKAADENGRVHTVFSQTTAVTGRLASSEPNLQNIPVRTELGREMRRFFIAGSPDRVLIDADYSQIELRLLAHIAGDTGMIKAFKEGMDIHTATASQVFGVPPEQVTREMRKSAKAVNFGIVYGISEFSLAADIGVTRKEAGQYIKNYFEKYSGISEYLHAAVESARALGYVETIFGRRRYIPELTSSKAAIRSFGERVAMNSPIQGSSADIIKLAMINVRKALKDAGLDARLILQIHDELIVEASEQSAKAAAEILEREMENVVHLSVPLIAETSTGKSWFECK